MLDCFAGSRSGQGKLSHLAAAAVAVMLGSQVIVAADPIISEFLAFNRQTNKDEDGDASDWIEIYNPNSTSISLDGYFLTDKRSKLTKWKVPNIALAGKGYLLVWASDKNRTDPAKPLHTNFKLAETGAYLGLVKPDGATIASDFGAKFPPPKMDISFGVPPAAGPDDYLIPTPIAANKPASLVADIVFDHDRGLYTKPFDLSLSSVTTGVSIRYTTDGNMPTTTTGTLYSRPIRIDNTTVIHAIGFQDGRTSTAVFTASYIFPANVLRQPEDIVGYPNPKEPINNPGPHQVDVPLTYGMNPDIVNDPQYAQQALEGLSQIPTVSIGVNPGTIFGPNGFYDTPRRKEGSKIPISFEYIDPQKSQSNIGVTAAITAHAKPKLKRSFHIHFNSKYGPSKLRAPIFDSAPFGGGGATNEFDDLILRAGNNRSWAATGSSSKTTYTEDEYVRQTQIAMTGQGVHGTFVHLYINGIYW
ncbi:MAG: hypothetical protein JWM57_1740, partial [Phycisphaerales bacterium]|nr:hypothetical protein [Phycisphaerales bacterium]